MARSGTAVTEAPRTPGYGWLLVAAGALSLAYQAAVVGGKALFVVAIPEESGWSRAATSAAVSALVLGSGLWAPVVGLLVQRWGARRTMSLAALLIGAGLALAGLARDPVELGLVLLLVVAPGSMGVGSLANFAAIQAWFAARRGTALALADSGSSLGLMVVVPLIQLAIETSGWRGAFLALGLAGLLLAPLHWLVQRPPPRLLPGSGRGEAGRADGTRPESEGTAGARPEGEGEAPAGALRALVLTRRFGLLVTGLSSVWLAQQVVTTHQAAYLADHEYDAASIAAAFAVIGATGLAGRPAFGWLSDRLGTTPTFTLLTAFLVTGIGCLVLAGDGRLGPALWLYGVALGVSLGVGTLLFARQVSALFGAERFGTVMGLGYFFGSAVGALGASAAGLARDLTGTYLPSFGVAALAALLALGCVGLLGRAGRRSAAADGPA